jgi:hypothetical protein
MLPHFFSLGSAPSALRYEREKMTSYFRLSMFFYVLWEGLYTGMLFYMCFLVIFYVQ